MEDTSSSHISPLFTLLLLNQHTDGNCYFRTLCGHYYTYIATNTVRSNCKIYSEESSQQPGPRCQQPSPRRQQPCPRRILTASLILATSHHQRRYCQKFGLDLEKERESWEAASQSMKMKLETA
ncbi:Uncharacterized protein Fot_22059 [Forsythia ovata]|uniref:Uncharacterized protein n=1 Tax=Forsythia ovata TaxID=205694 RepID=A0ABD1UYG5_9LAMI